MDVTYGSSKRKPLSSMTRLTRPTTSSTSSRCLRTPRPPAPFNRVLRPSKTSSPPPKAKASTQDFSFLETTIQAIMRIIPSMKPRIISAIRWTSMSRCQVLHLTKPIQTNKQTLACSTVLSQLWMWQTSKMGLLWTTYSNSNRRRIQVLSHLPMATESVAWLQLTREETASHWTFQIISRPITARQITWLMAIMGSGLQQNSTQTDATLRPSNATVATQTGTWCNSRAQPV